MRKLTIWYFDDDHKRKTEHIKGTYREGVANTLKKHFDVPKDNIVYSHGSLLSRPFKMIFILTVDGRQFAVNVKGGC